MSSFQRCFSSIVAFGAVAMGLACQRSPSAELRFPTVGDEVPRYGEAVFPNDALLTAEGTIAPRIPGLEDVAPLASDLLGAHLAALDGFGLRPLVEVFVDGPLDEGSVPAQSASTADPLFVIHLASGRVARMEWRVDEARGRVAGVPFPGVVLEEGARYAVVVTREVRDAEGVGLAPPEGYARLLEAQASELPWRWRSTRAAHDQVVALGVERGRIALVASFTTQRASAPLLAARALLDEGRVPRPALAFPDEGVIFRGDGALRALLGEPARDALERERLGWANESGMAHEHVGVVGTGVMTAPRFLAPDLGDDLPGSDTFVTDEAGDLVVVEPAAALPVTFVIPKSSPPAGGYPTAIFGHGLGASRHQVLAFAEPLAARGWAVAAIDMNDHGSRFKDVDERNNNADLLAEFAGDAALRDGFGDETGAGSTFALVHEFKNVSAIRDSVRQSVIDLCALAKLLRSPELDLAPLVGDGEAAPRLDGSRVVYLGESFGGVVGAVFSAVEPSVELFVLDVPGGGILDLAMLGSPNMRPMIELWLSSVYGIDDRIDRFHPLVGMAQGAIDGADPLTFAPHVLSRRFAVGGVRNPPRHLVMLEVVGDEVLPNRATHALARAAGVELMEPYLLPIEGVAVASGPVTSNVAGSTGVLVQWSPATHGANWTSERGRRDYLPFGDGEEFVRLEQPVEIPNPIRETLEQVLHVLDSYRDEGAPSVLPVQAAVADFDADGVTDSDELARGRDPYAAGR